MIDHAVDGQRNGCSRHGVTRLPGEASVPPERSPWTGMQSRERTMRGILLWLIGIPIPIIILLYLFNVL
jgi:hypothetical protein